jgi:hypothetical protein
MYFSAKILGFEQQNGTLPLLDQLHDDGEKTRVKSNADEQNGNFLFSETSKKPLFNLILEGPKKKEMKVSNSRDEMTRNLRSESLQRSIKDKRLALTRSQERKQPLAEGPTQSSRQRKGPVEDIKTKETRENRQNSNPPVLKIEQHRLLQPSDNKHDQVAITPPKEITTNKQGSDKPISLTFKNMAGKAFTLQWIKLDEPFDKVRSRLNKRIKPSDDKQIKMIHRGSQIKLDSTPRMLEMIDKDIIVYQIIDAEDDKVTEGQGKTRMQISKSKSPIRQTQKDPSVEKQQVTETKQIAEANQPDQITEIVAKLLEKELKIVKDQFNIKISTLEKDNSALTDELNLIKDKFWAREHNLEKENSYLRGEIKELKDKIATHEHLVKKSIDARETLQKDLTSFKAMIPESKEQLRSLDQRLAEVEKKKQKDLKLMDKDNVPLKDSSNLEIEKLRVDIRLLFNEVENGSIHCGTCGLRHNTRRCVFDPEGLLRPYKKIRIFGDRNYTYVRLNPRTGREETRYERTLKEIKERQFATSQNIRENRERIKMDEENRRTEMREERTTDQNAPWGYTKKGTAKLKPGRKTGTSQEKPCSEDGFN